MGKSTLLPEVNQGPYLVLQNGWKPLSELEKFAHNRPWVQLILIAQMVHLTRSLEHLWCPSKFPWPEREVGKTKANAQRFKHRLIPELKTSRDKHHNIHGFM